MPRVMVSDRTVTVFGGSGFIGRHVVRAFAAEGWRIRNACRRPDLAGHLQPLGSVGQIHSVQANVRDAASVRSAVEGADAVVNLVAILNESGRQRFEEVHVNGARRVAEAAAEAGVSTLVHLSALGVDERSTSAYARTKAKGEAAVLKAFSRAVVLRPSVVFGQEDQFFNRFGAMARLMPVLPLVGGGKTRFQPVFAGDVGDAVVAAGRGDARHAAVYELGGPEVKTLREILEYILQVTGRRRALVPLPFSLASLQARFLQMLPSPMLTVDQVELLKTDNVVSQAAVDEHRTLADLGVKPTGYEGIAPAYLVRYRKAGQFTDLHAH